MPSDIKTSSDIENVDWSTGSAPHYANCVRFGSSSSQASQSSGDICRICHCESDPQNPLLTPCYCSGSLKFVHQACLQQWLTASETNACELCKFPFIMHTKIKPFNEWRSLDMSGVERRRLCCAVLFHCAAALCVIWSLCVLIERAAEEVKRGMIGWPFWTKLAVVTVGLTGGIVFMYIQCRQYLHLCHRWRARNRILLIQNAPEKLRQLSPPSPVLQNRNVPLINNTAVSSGRTTNSFNYNYNQYPSSRDCVDHASPSNHTNGNGNSNAHYTQPPQHGQIVANIESNSQNYDRDWTLDDVSQISSFRPCPQGSGSMTPFHDSVHNVLETSRSGSNSISGSRQDLSSIHPITSTDSFKPNPIAMPPQPPPEANNCTTVTGNRCYPNSSVFLENRDILNDIGFPKISYRHSSVFASPDISDNLDKFLGKDLRRYSDTKLLTHNSEVLNPIFNVAIHTNPAKDEFRQKQHHHKDKSGRNQSVGGDSIVQNILGVGAPQITDIIFESATQLDPLELNIQEMLDMDQRQGQGGSSSRKKLRRSLNTVESAEYHHQPHEDEEQQQIIEKNRMSFKSLPNLSSSCESLIKK